MNRTKAPSQDATSRQALKRRINRLYKWINEGDLRKCFSLIDPRIRGQQRVQEGPYTQSLQEFKEAYGQIQPWYIRISLHLDGTRNKHDDRPFAYVYILWQDQAHAFHLFRERWVQDCGRWYTRVVGLVVNSSAKGSPE
jgi:hypothetical protein